MSNSPLKKIAPTRKKIISNIAQAQKLSQLNNEKIGIVKPQTLSQSNFISSQLNYNVPKNPFSVSMVVREQKEDREKIQKLEEELFGLKNQIAFLFEKKQTEHNMSNSTLSKDDNEEEEVEQEEVYEEQQENENEEDGNEEEDDEEDEEYFKCRSIFKQSFIQENPHSTSFVNHIPPPPPPPPTIFVTPSSPVKKSQNKTNSTQSVKSLTSTSTTTSTTRVENPLSAIKKGVQRLKKTNRL